MLRRINRWARVKSHPADAVRTLTSKLPATYQPIIRPLIERQSDLFGVPQSAFTGGGTASYARSSFSEDDVIDAEIYAFGSVLIILCISETLRLSHERNDEGEIVTTEEKSCTVRLTYAVPFVEDPDVAEFEKILAEIWNGIEFRDPPSRSRRLREMAQGKQNTTRLPTEGELDAAEALSDKSVRRLAIAIKSSSGLLLGDAPKQIPPRERGRIDAIVQLLIDKGLVDTEIVVICRDSSAQVNRVATADVLNGLDKQGVRCACGRPLSEEKHEKALSVTDFARSMLDGSAWLSILVLQYLLNFGVPIQSVRMEQEYSGEEVDCVAEIYGRLVLFELKDKEFNLGNAYSFGAKVGIFGPDVPVIVTTEKVGADARDHFARSAVADRRSRRYATEDPVGDGGIKFIEGLDSLKVGIEGIVTEIAGAALAPQLRAALSFSSAHPAALLAAWAGVERSSTPE
ncbi:hypothetical protein [Streptomyces auratus]|uniref:Uncharacterized protein n=1 Tax=Streptomyces auratus AGR0001 TaxID=1160718 RepID=A0A8B1NC41_9ACTN|nr:hypothetical protein [Streptomyces auratus]QTZ92843.1 hypothetical protein SU9_016285 [Streptomyces auratus AGR0001]